MANWYECKIRYEKTIDGKTKKVNESYLVDGLTYTEAETRILETLCQYISGEYTITNIKRSRIIEIFTSEVDAYDRWYNCKINIITLDEEKGVEKKTPQLMLVHADTIDTALARLREGLKDTLYDYTIVSIAESAILDYFPYKVD